MPVSVLALMLGLMQGPFCTPCGLTGSTSGDLPGLILLVPEYGSLRLGSGSGDMSLLLSVGLRVELGNLVSKVFVFSEGTWRDALK